MTDSSETKIEEAGKNFSESRVEADGFSIRYREAGDGLPLIWLHGGGGLRLSPVYDMLSETYRVIALEVPGFGDSAINERSRNMQDLADTILAAATALGIDRFELVGTSFGGTLAANIAVRAPERVNTLVLCSPAAIRINKPAPPGPKLSRENFLHAHPERQPPRKPRPAEMIAKEQAFMGRVHGPNRNADLEAQLSTLEVQTLVLLGTEDPVFGAELADIYRDLMPACQVVMIYDAAHAIDADRPEAVYAVMTDFIARHESFLVRERSGLLYP